MGSLLLVSIIYHPAIRIHIGLSDRVCNKKDSTALRGASRNNAHCRFRLSKWRVWFIRSRGANGVWAAAFCYVIGDVGYRELLTPALHRLPPILARIRATIWGCQAMPKGSSFRRTRRTSLGLSTPRL